jgi:hypothetical protein
LVHSVLEFAGVDCDDYCAGCCAENACQSQRLILF